MAITKVIVTEETTGTNPGAATSIGSATCVRLCNASNASVTVGISTAVGAATTNYFTMPQYSVEFLQKFPTDVIWTSAAIKANQVAFTN